MHERRVDSSDGLFCLLYVSEMSPPDAHEVARVCEESRRNNLRDDITGLLVFDGHAFCQFVEGGQRVITALLERLERDPRHRNLRVLQLGPLAGARRFPSWRLGYAYSADPAAIAALRMTRDEAALRTFEDWAPALPRIGKDDD